MSMKSLDLSVSMRSLDLTGFDEFMNSFEIDCDKTIHMSTTDDATSFRPAERNIVPPTNPRPMPKAATQQSNVVAAAPPPLPLTSVTPIRPAVDVEMPKKPLRPLTAYHTFLQIEREYIVQTMDGEDSDKSLHDDKVYLDYVPERYRQIKLSPEWYFGPGKRRKKRRHRKGHGKVGFLELSQMISSRWAKLDETHPDIKTFVQKIADQELAEYRRDMEVYKRYIKENGLSTPVTTSTCSSKSKKTKKRKEECLDQSERGVTSVSEDQCITLEPCVITPNSSLRNVHEDAPSPVLGNDLRGFEYLPATKFRRDV
jgi:hypothetical protein